MRAPEPVLRPEALAAPRAGERGRAEGRDRDEGEDRQPRPHVGIMGRRGAGGLGAGMRYGIAPMRGKRSHANVER